MVNKLDDLEGPKYFEKHLWGKRAGSTFGVPFGVQGFEPYIGKLTWKLSMVGCPAIIVDFPAQFTAKNYTWKLEISRDIIG